MTTKEYAAYLGVTPAAVRMAIRRKQPLKDVQRFYKVGRDWVFFLRKKRT